MEFIFALDIFQQEQFGIMIITLSQKIFLLKFSKYYCLILKKDIDCSKRVTQFISQSKTTQNAFKKIYNVDTPIIHSPINYNRFKNGLIEKKEDFYLIVSRLEEWKKIEFAIDAFNINGKKLKIIGKGSLEKKLKKNQKKTSVFRKYF